MFTNNQIALYHEQGYLHYPKLFTEEEIKLLSQRAHTDKALDLAAADMDDGEGNPVRLSLWNHPGDGIYGMFARCHKLVDKVEQLLEGEVYHYHSKMVLKDAKIGGAWAWHQDYGYWYQNGLLFPDLCSVMIAVDRATMENGCLQVLAGSHRMGRINHVLSGEQAGADRERVMEASKTLKKVHCEMEPGDALFFHCNLLHASAANHSDHSRWSMICCYNKATNDPFKESHHPGYTPLKKVPNEKILEVGRADIDSSPQFANLKQDDQSARSLDS